MGKIDKVRGFYMGSPPWVHATVGPVLSRVPPSMLYGKTFRRTQADIARSARDAEFVEQRVGASLRALLSCAVATPYYGEALSGIDVATATVADLGRVPITTKDVVRLHTDEMLVVPREQLEASQTSGTSEAFLTVYLDRDRSVREWAFVSHVWYGCGYRLGDRRAVLRHGHSDFANVQAKYWVWEPGSGELRLSPLRMVPAVMNEYLDLIRRYRIAFIHGYPSAIALLAAHARNIGWSAPPTLKGVLPISESLLDHQRPIIREGFGDIPIRPSYGLTEKVAFAAEILGQPGHYEFEPLYGIAEVVDAAGRPAGPGQRGRLLGTGFISVGMPLIRYDTGDLATVVELPSAANCWRLRVKDLVSCYRQDYVVTSEGGLVTPTSAYVYNDRLVREFQFAQHEPGRVVLRVIPLDGVTPEQLDFITDKIHSTSGGLITAELEIVDEIPTTARGKRRFVEQHLDLAEFADTDD
jgi:phenylacetate-CoA ligase